MVWQERCSDFQKHLQKNKDFAYETFWKAYLFGTRPSDFLLGDELADGLDTAVLNAGFEEWLRVMGLLNGLKME